MGRGIWAYIDQTLNMDSLPFTWRFYVKDVSIENVSLCKARCCLCDNLQPAFRDFDPDNLYASIVKQGVILIFVSMIAVQKLKVEDAAVDIFYLYEDMDKPIAKKQLTESSGKETFQVKIFLVKRGSLYSAWQADKIRGFHIQKKLPEWYFLSVHTGPATLLFHAC